MIGPHRKIRDFVIAFIVIAIIAQGLYFASYTGLFSFETSSATYEDRIDKNFSADSSYLWSASNTNFETINSVKISGNLYGSGNAKVYLISKSDKVLIFDSSKIPRGGGSSLTGLAVDEQDTENKTKDNKKEEQEVIIDYNITEENVSFDNSSDLNQSIFLDLANITLDTNISEQVNQTQDSNVTLTNVSETQNTTQEQQQTQQVKEIKKEEKKELTSFSNICVDSCYLNQSEKSYTLEVVISGVLTLEVNSILYDVTRKQNRVPQISRIPDLEIPSFGFTLNLLDFAFDVDGDNIVFSSTSLDNFDILFNDSNANIIPHEGFTGNETVWFYVSDGINETVSYGVVLISTSNYTKGNVTYVNITNETTIQYKAKLGQPVRWVRKIKLDELKKNVTIELPKDASDINTYKILDGKRLDIDEEILNQENKIKEEQGSLITGGVIGAQENTPLEQSNSTLVLISEEVDELEIEYNTSAPYAIEEQIGSGKKVKIVGPEDVHYEDVLSFTNIDESLNLIDAGNLEIYWEENKTYISPLLVNDTDQNGIFDYVEWIAPSLSNQTFDIIVITKAIHLDSNKTFISDIYPYVRELDDNWSEVIPSGHYVRVTFEQNLTSENDITIYARTLNGTPKIEVYEKNGDYLVAEFENITNNDYNKVYLTSLNASQDTFDLYITGGDLEFDHIIDPIIAFNTWTADISMAPIDNETFVLAWINASSNNTVFQIQNTNGTVKLGPVLVNTSVGSNVSRISVTMLNSTDFAIGWINYGLRDDLRAIFNVDGTRKFGDEVGDGEVGATNYDVALSALGDRFVYCYVDNTEGDADVRVYLNNGSLVGAETDIDTAISPATTLDNILDCVAINDSRAAVVWYDGGAADDITFNILSQTGTVLYTDTDIDNAVGNTGKAAVTSLYNNRAAVVFYDSADADITITIRDVDNNVRLAPKDIEVNAGTDNRVAIATIKNETKEYFVVVWLNNSLQNVTAAVFDDNGTAVTNPFIVNNNPPTNFPIVSVLGKDQLGNTICPGTFVVAYTNVSGRAIAKTYYMNGSTWDSGICNSPPALSNLSAPQNITYNNNYSVSLNFTISSGAASCWYTLNGGAQVSISCLGYVAGNAINVSGEGGYNLMVFASNSEGYTSSTGVNFTVNFCSGQENWIIDGMGGTGNASVTSLVCENQTITLDENLTIKNYGNLTFRNVTLVVNNTVWNNTILVDNFGNFSILSNGFYPSKINATSPGGSYVFIVNATSRFFVKDSSIFYAGIISGTDPLSITRNGLYIAADNASVINTTIVSFINSTDTSSDVNVISIVNASYVLFNRVIVNMSANGSSTNILRNTIYLANTSNSNFTDVVINYSLRSKGFKLEGRSDNNTFDRVIIDSDMTLFSILDSVGNKIYNSILRVKSSSGSGPQAILLGAANNTIIKNTTISRIPEQAVVLVTRLVGRPTQNLTIHDSFFNSGGSAALSNIGVNNTYILNSNFSKTAGAALLSFSDGYHYLLNNTFARSTLDVSSTANASVAWFFNVNVTYSNGSAANGVNMSLYDKDNKLIFSQNTGVDGFTPIENITEYTKDVNGITPYGNHTLNTNLTGFTAANVSLNITQSMTQSVVLSSSGETIPPNLTLSLPRNMTYNNNYSVEFNFTTSSDFASCWYTLNGGASVNISCLGYNTGNSLNVSGEGGYNLIVFANDSLGNKNSTGVNFTVNFCSGEENWIIDGFGGVGNASVTSLVCENKTIMLNENLTIKNYGNLTFRNITLVVNATVWNNTILVDNYGNFSILSNGFYRSKINGTSGDGDYRFIINNSRFFIKDSFIYNAGISGESANNTDEGVYIFNGNVNFINTSVESTLYKNATSTIIIINTSNAYFYGVKVNKTGLGIGTTASRFIGKAFYLNNVSNSNFTDVVVNRSIDSRGFDIYGGSNNNTFDRVIIESNFSAFVIIDSIENKIYNSVILVSSPTLTVGDGIKISNANNTVFKNLTASKDLGGSLSQLFRPLAPMTYNLTIHDSFFDQIGGNSGFTVTAMNGTYILNSNFTRFSTLFGSGTAGTTHYILNTTTNIRPSGGGAYNITVAWFFNVNVTDSNGAAVNGANSTLYNNSQGFVFSDLSGANGLTLLENVSEYIIGGGVTYYGNYTLITNYSAYSNSNISINITSSMTQNVVFDFDPTVVNITIFPKLPLTTENLNCTFKIQDNDTSTRPININVTWYRDGTFITSYYFGINNGTENSTILTSANTTKSENWICSITPYDGVLYGPQRNASVIIQNSAPSQVTLDWPINSLYTLTNRTINFTWNAATDADNDLLVYDIFLECFSACSDDSRVAYNISSASYRFPADIKYLRDITSGTYYNWTIRAYDNTSYGTNSTTFNFSIASSVTISLANDTVWFGTKNPLDYDDTTDRVPPGFNLTNQGNSIINVNISLFDSGLWSRKPSPTPFFSYKITNKSDKAGAFNFTNSVTIWTSIPLSNTTSIVALLYSNYSNINDTVIIDLNITVPSDEPQADRASRMSFIAQLA